jgi:hypothetical protein
VFWDHLLNIVRVNTPNQLWVILNRWMLTKSLAVSGPIGFLSDQQAFGFRDQLRMFWLCWRSIREFHAAIYSTLLNTSLLKAT